jgi:hypothetical protein
MGSLSRLRNCSTARVIIFPDSNRPGLEMVHVPGAISSTNSLIAPRIGKIRPGDTHTIFFALSRRQARPPFLVSSQIYCPFQPSCRSQNSYSAIARGAIWTVNSYLRRACLSLVLFSYQSEKSVRHCSGFLYGRSFSAADSFPETRCPPGGPADFHSTIILSAHSTSETKIAGLPNFAPH